MLIPSRGVHPKKTHGFMASVVNPPVFDPACAGGEAFTCDLAKAPGESCA
jgi:hypothetical protein